VQQKNYSESIINAKKEYLEKNKERISKSPNLKKRLLA
jgi:hypothetical protein